MSKSSGDSLKVAIDAARGEIEADLQDALLDQLVALGDRDEIGHRIVGGIGRRARGWRGNSRGRTNCVSPVFLLMLQPVEMPTRGDAIGLARRILRRAGAEDRHAGGIGQNHGARGSC